MSSHRRPSPRQLDAAPLGRAQPPFAASAGSPEQRRGDEGAGEGEEDGEKEEEEEAGVLAARFPNAGDAVPSDPAPLSPKDASPNTLGGATAGPGDLSGREYGETPPEFKWAPYATTAESSQKDPLLPVTSHFLSPAGLFWVRACLSTYLVAFLIFYISNQVYAKRPVEFVLVFFTNLTFFAEIAYIWVSTFHSFNYVYNSKTKGRPPPAFVTVPFLLRLHAWLYSTVAVFHVVVPTVYWSLLSRDLVSGAMPARDVIGSVGTHAVDFVLMATEVVFGRNVVRRSHWRVILAVFCTYILLAYINYWVNGWFVYSFADYTQPSWYLWYIALLLLLTAVFVMQFYLHKLRDRIGLRMSRMRVMSDEPLAMAEV